MTNSKSSPMVESEFGYGQIFAILSRRRYWILGTLCASLVIATVVNLRAKSTYQSSMQFLVEPNYKQAKGGGSSESQLVTGTSVEVDIATQLTLMRSSEMFQKAAGLLEAEGTKISIAELQSLKVGQLSQDKTATKIFQIEYSSDDPVKTRQVLKAFKQVYLEYNLEQQQLRLTNGLAFIDKQIPVVQKNIADATSALEKFRQTHNIFDASQRVTEVSSALSAIDQQKRANTIEYEQLLAKANSLQQELGLSPQAALASTRLNQSSRYLAILAELQKTELTLAQEQQRFTNAVPLIQNLQDRFQSQLQLLGDEKQRIFGDRVISQEQWNANQLSAIDISLATQLVDAQSGLSAIDAKQQALSEQEQQLKTEIKRLPRLLSEYEALRPKLQLDQETLQTLLKARQQLSLEIARGGFDWQVVEEPRLGIEQAPTSTRNLMLAIVVGLFLGSAIAFLRDLQDDTVHTSAELERQIALPLLGMTPKFAQTETEAPTFMPQFLKGQALSPLSIDVLQWQPFRESLDLIYKNIQLLSFESPLRSVVVTSALSGEGKSTIALGLATSAARLHQRVLLVDADLRSPSLHKFLQLPNERGLSTLLTSNGSVPSTEIIQASNSNIDILTSGPIPTDSVNLLSSEWMKKLMSVFEQTYDLVIVDAPPVLGIVDAIQIGSICNGGLMIGRIDLVTRSEFAQATEVMKRLNLLGVIANGVTNRPNTYYMGKDQDKKNK
ncbi:polysaccharide biosynthesis tyrosine autokinase [Tumidithrix elongata RA019]|uniref:Polysaccharide biosynthesis tyrosine autokinase n=1 Tax=Tumidithrix elongata BACA0141 TaxID=2716417 RepID=A0AAW9PX18_9CYAN|nr:polysaccharide biosynthesis tyrosine autokinase [Tumidithrix elongata RA019]